MARGHFQRAPGLPGRAQGAGGASASNAGTHGLAPGHSGLLGGGEGPGDAAFSSVGAGAEQHTVWVFAAPLTRSWWEGDCHPTKRSRFGLERCSQQEGVWFCPLVWLPSLFSQRGPQNAPQGGNWSQRKCNRSGAEVGVARLEHQRAQELPDRWGLLGHLKIAASWARQRQPPSGSCMPGNCYFSRHSQEGQHHYSFFFF